MPIFFGSDTPFFGVGPHQSHGLHGVSHRIGLHVIPVFAQTIAQDDGVHAVVIKERYEVRRFATHVKGIVASAGHQNHGGSGVDAALDRVYFNRRIVNVGDAVDAARHTLAQVVYLGFVHPGGLEIGRPRWPKRHHHATLQDRLRRVGAARCNIRMRHADGRRDRRQLRRRYHRQ